MPLSRPRSEQMIEPSLGAMNGPCGIARSWELAGTVVAKELKPKDRKAPAEVYGRLLPSLVRV